jgi:hypothetical protein
MSAKVVSRKVFRDAFVRGATPLEGAERALLHYRNDVASGAERTSSSMDDAMTIDWIDISAHFRLAEAVGLHRYEELLAEHVRRITVATIAGHAIRVTQSERFGRLFAVGCTGRAFTKLEQAEAYARKHPILIRNQ